MPPTHNTANSIAMAYRLAWRNLWRNHRRTFIMLTAITLGAWSMIFMTSLLRGMVEDMLARGLDRLPGHAQIHHPLFLDDPSVVNSMLAPSDALLNQLKHDPAVVNWFARIKVPAMIASERETRGIQLLGLNPEKETSTFNHYTLLEGRYLNSADDQGLVIGAKLASKLETGLGRRVVVMSQDPDNELAEKGYRIVGIFKADMAALEETYIYSGLNTVQTLLKLPNQVSEVAIFGEETRHNSTLVNTLLPNIPSDLELKPWQEIDAYLASMVKFMDGFVLVWIIVVFLAMSFGLVNTLIMSIFERVREIGLMLALGMPPRLILLQVMFESILLLTVGLALGTALSVLTAWALKDGIDISSVSEALSEIGAGSMLYPSLQLKDIITANGVVIILGLCTSILPAWRASKYDPVRALNTAA